MIRLIIIFILVGFSRVLGVSLVLPTENEAIYRGNGEAFYQYVERNFEGVISYPWQGGQYGFVRNPMQTRDGIIFKRLHEGVDIKPLRRDENGEPLDLVRAVSNGTVTYVNKRQGASNYGLYVVIRHEWDGCPYYSLYAHLSSVEVVAGDVLRQGQTIGRLGYTGDGLNKLRAHLHFEINLYLTDDFNAWHSSHFRGEPNPHGVYNGMNLSGLDVSNFLVKAHNDGNLTIPGFLAKEDVFYRVKVPAPGPVELAKRYPWMAQEYRVGQAAEILFLRSGLPVKIVGLEEAVSAPQASWARAVGAPIGLYTKSYLQGAGPSLRLTAEGLKYLELFKKR